MIRKLYDKPVEFVTPTFLAGANQNSPEIRPPSIRGALRWWFRALGGEQALEKHLFGGVGGTPTSSKVVVRVANTKHIRGHIEEYSQGTSLGYLYYFAQESGNKEGIRRTSSNNFLMPGTSFELIISLRETLKKTDDSSIQKLDDSILAFIRLGSLGLRATRGCGAMTEADVLSKDGFISWAETFPKNIIIRTTSQKTFSDWETCQRELGRFLHELRNPSDGRPKIEGAKPSALGFSDGKKRESSALHLRPVKTKEGFLPVIVYTDAACSQKSLTDLVLSKTQALS